ncbi:GNAT family N-acetyltransferase [Bifidobacterium sp. ESL0763]|uniref:GNAT family N-acetyltransferase n=1 Tax=Bifidobacterium sp. ESL0763 TaxID=2983227 RepID=UPI0023F6AF26|nr:GNAT family N-acetyltransferase [Bifidobacterium sp. ESL0763]MDF7664276.1 GNAT family N-acetyltransferase [Bifidobacterium sp. ESL0763]
MRRNGKGGIEMDVIYAPVIWGDVDEIVRLFDGTWNHAEAMRGDRKLSLLRSYHFVLNLLGASTGGVVARQGGRLLGVALYRVEGQPRLFSDIAQQLARIDERLNSTPAGHQELGRIVAARRVLSAMERQTRIRKSAPGELGLLLVDPQSRGQGIGGELFGRAVRSFGRFEVPMFHLHADSACDLTFFDHHGMKRVAERLGKDHPGDGREGDMYIYAAIPSKVLSPNK